MKKLLLLLLLCCLGFTHMFAQAKPFNPALIEIGIVEKLDSIVPGELLFTTESGDQVKLADLITKPTVISFVYFDCPGMCGPLLAGVADVIAKVDMQLGVDFDALTFSFDPKDTPFKAVSHKINYVQEIDSTQRPFWKFLTADQTTIHTITEAVGWRYKPQGLDFAHPSAIMILSPEGKITRYLYGVDFLPFDLKMALIEAQVGKSQPTINKILEFCFSYDPQGRDYTLQITRIVASFTIAIALLIFITLLIKGRRKSVKK